MKFRYLFFLFVFFSPIAISLPTVDGNTITFPDDGDRWKLWDRVNLINVCRSWVDGLVCVAEAGSYAIVNVTQGTREPVVISGDPTDTGDTITVSNFESGDLVRYALPLIRGTATGTDTILVQRNGLATSWTVNDGRWRAFVSLQEGENNLSIVTDSGESMPLKLTYIPIDNEKVVRMVYLLGSDSAGVFDAPPGVNNTLDDAISRLKLAGRLLQSLTAELLSERGLERRTFGFMRDADHYPVVFIQISPLTIAELGTMNGVELWFHFEELMRDLPDRDDVIDMAIVADSRFDSTLNQTSAHVARGGFPLALFGSSSIHSWPTTVESIEARFTDARATEPFLNPEVGRSDQYWSNATTSLGAFLHELGHALGISGHTDNPATIMNRGFDYLNRAIVTFEPGHGSIDPNLDLMPQWDETSIEVLLDSEWLDTSGQQSDGPIIDGNTIIFPDDENRWKLYDRINQINVCKSWIDGLLCDADAGSYVIVNVTTGDRINIVVEDDPATDPGDPIVDGNSITFPDDSDRWKLYDKVNKINVCRSWVDGLVCQVDSGSYVIVNVTTGARIPVNIQNRYVDQGDGTVLDYNTGLVWLKDASCARLGPSDWDTSRASVALLADGACGLSDDSNPGDWRLPEITELCSQGAVEGICPAEASLDSLANSQFVDPPLSNTFGNGQWMENDPFVGVTDESLWSSTENVPNGGSAWRMQMVSPNIGLLGKALSLQGWPVRVSN